MRPCEGWCGYCYENARKRSNYKGHYGYRKSPSMWRSEVGRFIGTKPTSSPGAKPADRFVDDALAALYPALWEYLSVSAFEGGEVRQTSTLLLFTEDGLVKACLKDRELERTAWMSASSLSGVLSLLNEALEGDVAEWRVHRLPAKGKEKK